MFVLVGALLWFFGGDSTNLLSYPLTRLDRLFVAYGCINPHTRQHLPTILLTVCHAAGYVIPHRRPFFFHGFAVTKQVFIVYILASVFWSLYHSLCLQNFFGREGGKRALERWPNPALASIELCIRSIPSPPPPRHDRLFCIGACCVAQPVD